MSKVSPVYKIYTLGKFSVLHNTDMISEKNRNSRRIWELFKYLLTNRKKRFLPEDVLETLWPDREYADSKTIFRYYVHNIRQALAQNQLPEKAIDLVSSQGCYYLQVNRGCWLDVDEFEDLFRSASVIKKQNPVEAINMFYRAIHMYKGDYLPEVTGSWVFPVRNHYRYLYLQCVSENIELLKQEGRHREIIELCRSAFLIESFEEELHLSYMEALLEEGKAMQARNHYEYITALMYQEIGVKPSRAMQKIYRSIKENSESLPQDYTDIKDMLRKREKKSGALLCEPEHFRFLFEVERRRAERTGTPLHITLLTFTSPDYRVPGTEILDEAMSRLKQVVLTGLRKDDVISHWNEVQFAWLMPGMNFEQVETALERVKNRFNQFYLEDSVVLQGSVHSFLPWEDE